jgi:sugar phosphate isomerase/epimerase
MVLGVVIGGSDPLEALRAVHSIGLPTSQLYAPPLNWRTSEGATKIKAEAKAQDVQITSLICAFPGEDYSSLEMIGKTVGLVDPQTREERVAEIISVADFAADLGVKVVQGHIGFVPTKGERSREGVVTAVRRVTDHLKQNGQFFALETGQESAAELLAFINDVNYDNLKVNFDPANFLIYNSDEPLAALEVLKDYVIGVHCKDAHRPHKKCVLGSEEVLGKGEVGIPAFIAKLKEFGYAGPLTIERETVSDEQWKRDVLKAKELLEGLTN